MKRIIISTLSFLLSINLLGQLKQGSFVISGSSDISFSYTSSNISYDGNKIVETNNTQFNIKPMVGYFLIDDLSAGLFTNFGFASATQVDDSKLTTNNFSIGPFVRYYFDAGKVKPFGHLDFGYASYEEPNFEDREKIYSYVGYAINAGAGGAFFISKNLSIDALLTYRYLSFSYKEDAKLKISSGGIYFQVGISAFF